MFATMTVDHLFASFILLLISNTGFSDVFVQTGASVQLDIQTQELPEIHVLTWGKDPSTTIVTFITAAKRTLRESSYEERVEFNTETFSLTLKNMTKTDSGLYTARAVEDNKKIFAEYRVSVIDAVEAPVLTVNSNWFSGNFCTVTFTCRAHELMINSTYQNNRCSLEEVTSQINTLIMYCSEESIICNHSNPVSWREDRINITQLCDKNERQPISISYVSSYMTGLLIVCVVVGVIVFAGLILYCCCKNKKGVKQPDDTDYDDVETQKMTGDTWTTVTYCTVGRNQTPSSAHDC